MEKPNYKITHTRMVTIDEDELESLRRLAEPSTNNRGYHRQKVTNMSSRLSSNNSNNNILQEVTTASDDKEKIVITQVSPKKLESKKSEDINESAEKFIQQFKHQLLLQRLESIENVEKMLERGL